MEIKEEEEEEEKIASQEKDMARKRMSKKVFGKRNLNRGNRARNKRGVEKFGMYLRKHLFVLRCTSCCTLKCSVHVEIKKTNPVELY